MASRQDNMSALNMPDSSARSAESVMAHDFHAEGLSLSRGPRRLFANLSFSVAGGEVLILRGANGSGKTSLLRVLAGFTQPDAGSLFCNRLNLKPLDSVSRNLMLYVAHANAIKDDLSALENLQEALRLDGLPSAAIATEALLPTLDEVGLLERRHLPARKLSQGQKRRIGLARLALAHKAFWLLDEPTNALDAEGVGLFTGIVNRHLARGGMACIASHLPMRFVGTSREITLDMSA